MTARTISMNDPSGPEARGERPSEPVESGRPEDRASRSRPLAVRPGRPRRDSAPERLVARPAEDDERRPPPPAVLDALARLEDGTDLDALAVRLGVSSPTLRRWREKYRGPEPRQMDRLDELERENARLRKLVDQLRLDHYVLEQLLRERS